MKSGPRDGVVLVALSTLGFCAATLLVKALGPGVPVWLVVCVRCAVPLPLLAWLMRRRGLALRSLRWRALLVRGLWGTLSVACYFWALPRMPVADAVLLAHASPVYAVVWGMLLLGERPGAGVLASSAAAFLGVVLILRPQFSFSGAPYLAALLGGVFNSLALVSIKSLSSSEPRERIVFYSAAVGTAAFLPPALAAGFMPTAAQAAAMTGVGLALTFAQLAVAAGLERAPVSKAAGGLFFAFVLNAGLGWALWGEVPAPASWAGVVLICAGIIGLAGGFSRRPGAGFRGFPACPPQVPDGKEIR